MNKLAAAVKQFAFGGLIGYVIHDNLVSIARVDGTSMQPSLNPELFDSNDRPYLAKDWILLNKWMTKEFEIERGDIVVFR